MYRIVEFTKTRIIQSTFIALLVGCGSQQHSRIVVSSFAESQEEDAMGHYIELGTISDIDQWLEVDDSALKSITERRLADAYNASVVSLKRICEKSQIDKKAMKNLVV